MTNYVFEYEHSHPIGIQKFRTWEDVAKWINNERSFWEEALGSNTGHAAADAAKGHIINHLNTCTNSANVLIKNKDDQNAYNNLLAHLNGLYQNTGSTFNSSSIDAGLIKQISQDEGQEQAAIALSIITQKVGFQNTLEASNALFSYYALKHGFDKHMSSAAKSTVTRIIKKYNEAQAVEFDRVSEQLSKTDQQIIDNDKAKETSKAWAKSRRAYDLSENEKLHEKLTGQAEVAIAKIDETNETYTEFMSLKAPADYWITKSDEHKKKKFWFIGFNIVFYLIASFFLVNIIDLTDFTKTVMDGGVEKVIHMTIEEMIPLIGIRLFVVSLFVWFARILMRLYLSEHHLQNNSKEKSIMIMTYLALLEGGQVEKEQREIMLNQIFTQSADGIVKEDFSSMAGLIGVKANQ